MTSVFFYGLFMDKTLLEEKGFHPTTPILAVLNDYALEIGDRATLMKMTGRCVYGTVMQLAQEEIDTLYGGQSVADYLPEDVVITTFEKEKQNVVVYNLPMDKVAGPNHQYAQRLVQVASEVGLPEEYLKEIELFTR